MISTATAARRARAAISPAGLLWLAYAGLLALLASYYLVLLRAPGLGVDFNCFRAAAVVYLHGGNPFDFGQLWRAENALYNVPAHLQPGSPAYYYLDRYYNPPLFATLMRPLALLPFAPAYAVYTTLVVALAAAGTWLTLCALGWRRYRLLVVAIVLLSPSLFVAVRNGQQSTLLLFLLGAALYALRRDRPGLAGALLALSLVKPHLLGPFALAAPLLLPSWRQTTRMYAGFCAAAALGLALTVATTGAGSIAAWLHTLVAYGNDIHALNTSLPSLSGIAMDVLPHPWDRLATAALTLAGAAGMAAIVWHGRRAMLAGWACDCGREERGPRSGMANHGDCGRDGHVRRASAYRTIWSRLKTSSSGVPSVHCPPSTANSPRGLPWLHLGALVAVWLLCTPYAHANDDILLLVPLAVAWGRDGLARARLLPMAALWALSSLPLAFLLLPPLNALTAAPPALALAAVLARREVQP